MTTIITGANRGLGYETALTLAADTSRTIVLAGRDLASLEEAAHRIRANTGNVHLIPMAIDLAALASVRAFTAEFRSRSLPPLATLICNAAVSTHTATERSADGYELTFAVNHLGHFLLANLLLEALEPPARILVVSSGVHDPAVAGRRMPSPRYVGAERLAYPERDRHREKGDDWPGGQVYASSKLCNLLCTYELARRLESRALSTPARPITVNAFDPGLVAGTGLGRHARPVTRFVWYYVLPWLSRAVGFGRSAKEAGSDLAYLATAPELENVTGKYFSGREMTASSAESHDRDKAADLWNASVELSHLQPDESPLLGP